MNWRNRSSSNGNAKTTHGRAGQEAPGQETRPTKAEWENQGFTVRNVEIMPESDLSAVSRKVTYRIDGATNEDFEEPIFPIYVPPVPQQSQQTVGGNTKSAGGTDVATSDAYWAKASEQARSTSKWIATALGAALLAIVGTTPLSPLGGTRIDWFSLPGYLAIAGLFLLGMTIFLVLSVRAVEPASRGGAWR